MVGLKWARSRAQGHEVPWTSVSGDDMMVSVMDVRLVNTRALGLVTERQRPRVPSPVAAGLTRYRLVDPLGDVTVYEGEDTHEYIDLLRRFPVVEECEGGDRVTEVYRQGRVPYLEILD